MSLGIIVFFVFIISAFIVAIQLTRDIDSKSATPSSLRASLGSGTWSC